MKFQKTQRIKLMIAAAVLLLLAAVYVLGPGRQHAEEEILLAETMSGAGMEGSGVPSASGAEAEGAASVETLSSAEAEGAASADTLSSAETLSPAEAEALAAVEDEAKDRLYVHVCGEVVRPGVYALSAGSRVFAAVDAAGGLTENAAGDFLNMAAAVADGQQIRIPSREEAESLRAERAAGGNSAGSQGAAAYAGGLSGKAGAAGGLPGAAGQADALNPGGGAAGKTALVNINTAGAEELMTLPGIGASRAQDIISYRGKHKFGRIEDIMKVPGIKEGAFKKLRDRITV
ncbi:helix-hairpin-helix domain-containing protein [Clostridium vitabionis]|uniref:helix-hairpin-helix domain-containing protein n=1 Tax=Clostridium vitabionis TaxID=2784388 RepID=UPI001F23A280|nr:helix-hairpin-helix domain-containing protein [Clostridium vitabionis]